MHASECSAADIFAILILVLQSRFSPSVIVYPPEDPNSGLSMSPPKPANSRQACIFCAPSPSVAIITLPVALPCDLFHQARPSHDPIMNENAGLGPLPYSTTTHSHIVSPLDLKSRVEGADHKVGRRRDCLCCSSTPRCQSMSSRKVAGWCHVVTSQSHIRVRSPRYSSTAF